jgi:hypothetical protein
VTLRSDIHAALEAVTPSAPHLPTAAVDAAIRTGTPARRRRGLLVAAAAVPVLVAAALVVTLLRAAPLANSEPGLRPAAPPTPLVWTTWVADPSITAGPFPGYRPEILPDQPQVASVRTEQDPSGGGWDLVVTFTAEGRQLEATITTDAYNACGTGSTGTCPASRVTAWLDLTPDDVAHWNERADALYTTPGGKLVADPYVQEPVTDGTAILVTSLSRSEVESIAARVNHTTG